MGTLVGHVLPGIGFLLLGLWQLYNTMLNYVREPWNFRTRAWFPIVEEQPEELKENGKNKRRRLFSLKRHGELVFIMAGSLASISAELFIGPAKHQPLDDDGTIPSYHLNNFEHATVSLFFLIYAAVALFLDVQQHRLNVCEQQQHGGVKKHLTISRPSQLEDHLPSPPVPAGAVHMAAATAVAAQWLLFHEHSADHMGIEGHFHALLQILVLATLAGIVGEIAVLSASSAASSAAFLAACVRCSGLVLQGAWFVHMGLALWVPQLVPKGCVLQRGRVFCGDPAWLARARAVSNLSLCWYAAAFMVAAVAAFFAIAGKRGGVPPATTYELVELDEDPEAAGGGGGGGSSPRQHVATVHLPR